MGHCGIQMQNPEFIPMLLEVVIFHGHQQISTVHICD
jgi:hypothetical protein